MTATTPIYGLAYPEGTDLVSSAPDSFKSMAETVESALHTVDQRATPEGATPVIATTLAALQDETATIGQIGFVTADGDNTGPYAWSGSDWLRYAMLSALRDWREFTFKMQNSTSFAGFSYGGANRILYNPAMRLIRVDLTPFKSTVSVGAYQVYLPNKGTIKASRAFSIGQAFLDDGSIGRELTLNTDGSVTVGPEIKNGDLIHPLPNLIPVPSDVTLTTSDGTTI